MADLADTRPSPKPRDASIDVARGLAVLLMIQTHGYDGWASADAKATFAYRVSRELGAIPAPIFLLLAGMGLGMADAASEAKGADAGGARRGLAVRGLRVLLAGYVVSLAYACIDWSFRPETLFRADILHAIGISLAACAVLLVRRRHAGWIALGIATVALALPLVLPPVPASWPFAARAVAALFVDVGGLTKFPVLPLVAFVALGHALGRAYRSGAVSPRVALVACVALALAAALLELATHATVAAMHAGPLTHAHPAVTLNFLDGTARALAVVALSIAATPALPGRLRTELALLGRASLFAYAIHIPFAYGRLASPVSHRLSMPLATVAYLTLCLLVWLSVRLKGSLQGDPTSRNRKASRAG